MRLLILLFFITINISISNAQRQYSSNNVEVQWGPLESRKLHTTHGEFIGFDSTGHYTIRNQKNKYWIAKYNVDMSREREVELNTVFYQKSFQLKFVVDLNDVFLGMIVMFDKNKGGTSYYIQQIDKNTLQFIGQPELISHEQNLVYKKIARAQISYQLSDDFSKILISYKLPSDADKQLKNKIIVVDCSAKKVLWTKEIKLPFEEKYVKVNNRLLSNNGGLYFVGKSKFNDYIVYVYQNDTIFDFPVGFEDKKINEMRLVENKDGNIIGAGFYSEAVNNYSIKGSFFIEIDKNTNEILQKSFMDFSIDFIKAYMTEREEKSIDKKLEKGKNVEMYQYSLDHFIKTQNGDFILVAEQYYSETRSYYSHACRCVQTYTVYFYNDIILVGISPKDGIKWMEKIPKNQVGQNPSNFGYCIALTDDKVYIVYNNNPKNFEGPKSNNQNYFSYNGGASAVTLSTINIERNGYHDMEVLWYSSDISGFTSPRRMAQQLDNNTLMMYIQGSKGSQRYVKLKLR
jgi:hypothetical protein